MAMRKPINVFDTDWNNPVPWTRSEVKKNWSKLNAVVQNSAGRSITLLHSHTPSSSPLVPGVVRVI